MLGEVQGDPVPDGDVPQWGDHPALKPALTGKENEAFQLLAW